MVLQSPKKDSGNPDFLPTQSLPERTDSGVFNVVGPMAIGVVVPGVLGPPDWKAAEFTLGLSVGKAFES